jgi:hypothetical protein
MQQISRDWMTEYTVQLIEDVPAEYLNPLNLNPPWDLICLIFVLKGTLLPESALAILF